MLLRPDQLHIKLMMFPIADYPFAPQSFITHEEYSLSYVDEGKGQAVVRKTLPLSRSIENLTAYAWIFINHCNDCILFHLSLTVNHCQSDSVCIMKFTEEEQKMIALLRNQHENWRAIRVIILVSSCICGAFAIDEFFRGGSQWLFPGVMAAYGLSYTLGSWSGRPEISLLLKLIEEQDNKQQGSCGLHHKCCVNHANHLRDEHL
ncbi:hypothetical protein VU07_03950 [Desulfobulbus sp. F4]|nr:hypothetical protein [Desulfobulbus sp. F4]